MEENKLKEKLDLDNQDVNIFGIAYKYTYKPELNEYDILIKVDQSYPISDQWINFIIQLAARSGKYLDTNDKSKLELILQRVPSENENRPIDVKIILNRARIYIKFSNKASKNANMQKNLSNTDLLHKKEDLSKLFRKFYSGIITIPTTGSLERIPISICSFNLQPLKKKLHNIKQNESEELIKKVKQPQFLAGKLDKEYVTPKNLFTKSALQFTNFQRILIIGGAGYGKTSFCKYLVHKWSTNQDWLTSFTYIYWIQLKCLLTYETKAEEKEDFEQHLAKFIKYCMDYSLNEMDFDRDISFSIEEINDTLNNKLEKKLFILDGYNEITHLNELTFQGRLFHSLLKQKYYILTSRPVHISANISIGHLKRFELVGFTNTDKQIYIYNVFKDKEKAEKEEFNIYLRNNRSLNIAAQAPLNLSLLCGTWDLVKEHKYSYTVTDIFKKLIFKLQVRYLQDQSYILNAERWNELKVEEFCSPVMLFLEQLAYKLIKNNAYELAENKISKIIKKHENAILKHIQDIEKIWNISDPKIKFDRNSIMDNLVKVGMVYVVGLQEFAIDRKYSFTHQAIRDFFAANYIAKMLSKINVNKKNEHKQLNNKLLSFIKNNIQNPNYEDIWKFLAGILQNEALNLFLSIYSKNTNGIGPYRTLVESNILTEIKNKSHINIKLLVKLAKSVDDNVIYCTLTQNSEFFWHKILDHLKSSQKIIKYTSIPYIISKIFEDLYKSLFFNNYEYAYHVPKLLEALGRLSYYDQSIIQSLFHYIENELTHNWWRIRQLEEDEKRLTTNHHKKKYLNGIHKSLKNESISSDEKNVSGIDDSDEIYGHKVAEIRYTISIILETNKEKVDLERAIDYALAWCIRQIISNCDQNFIEYLTQHYYKANPLGKNIILAALSNVSTFYANYVLPIFMIACEDADILVRKAALDCLVKLSDDIFLETKTNLKNYFSENYHNASFLIKKLCFEDDYEVRYNSLHVLSKLAIVMDDALVDFIDVCLQYTNCFWTIKTFKKLIRLSDFEDDNKNDLLDAIDNANKVKLVAILRCNNKWLKFLLSFYIGENFNPIGQNKNYFDSPFCPFIYKFSINSAFSEYNLPSIKNMNLDKEIKVILSLMMYHDEKEILKFFESNNINYVYITILLIKEKNIILTSIDNTIQLLLKINNNDILSKGHVRRLLLKILASLCLQKSEFITTDLLKLYLNKIDILYLDSNDIKYYLSLFIKLLDSISDFSQIDKNSIITMLYAVSDKSFLYDDLPFKALACLASALPAYRGVLKNMVGNLGESKERRVLALNILSYIDIRYVREIADVIVVDAVLHDNSLEVRLAAINAMTKLNIYPKFDVVQIIVNLDKEMENNSERILSDFNIKKSAPSFFLYAYPLSNLLDNYLETGDKHYIHYILTKVGNSSLTIYREGDHLCYYDDDTHKIDINGREKLANKILIKIAKEFNTKQMKKKDEYSKLLKIHSIFNKEKICKKNISIDHKEESKNKNSN